MTTTQNISEKSSTKKAIQTNPNLVTLIGINPKCETRKEMVLDFGLIAFLCALLALLVFIVGCSTTNVSELVKAASGDTNTISLHVMSPWGVAIDYQRNPRP